MTYSINQVADKFGVSAHTIRFYEKEGLLPFVRRNASGNRAFTESDVSIFHTICCLKNTGMPIKEIKAYIQLVMEGACTVERRKALMVQHRENVLAEIASLQAHLAEVERKIERYSAPDAVAVINKQIEYMRQEKAKHDLN